MSITITAATPSDWPAIKDIYLEGIQTGHATFETGDDLPSAEGWFAGKLDNLSFKAVNDKGEMLGWVALSGTSDRCVYAGVAEVSVYVASAARGQGVGRALLAHEIEASEDAGLWTLQAGIFPENTASVSLHEKLGFRVVGTREKLGKLKGVWRDVLFMERRSSRIL
ncbi:MAG: N-acetyltransferase family protein [Deinococcota bacterium]